MSKQAYYFYMDREFLRDNDPWRLGPWPLVLPNGSLKIFESHDDYVRARDALEAEKEKNGELSVGEKRESK